MTSEKRLGFDPRAPIAQAILQDAFGAFNAGVDPAVTYDADDYLERIAERAHRDWDEIAGSDYELRNFNRIFGVIKGGIEQATSRRKDFKRKISLLRNAVDTEIALRTEESEHHRS